MAENIYNIDSMIIKYIHRPIIQNKPEFPLYSRIGNEIEVQSDAQALKDPDWVKTSLHTYNSPTNVRRLFIGEHKVFIQFYQPPISKGKSSGEYWKEVSFKNEDDLELMVKSIESFPMKQQEALMNRSKIPSKPRVTKTGLGGLSSKWKMSNIEEIYISPAILYSEDVIRIAGNKSAIILNMFKSTPQGYWAKDDSPLRLFEDSNGSNIKNIRTRFPRLRTVAIMSNIDTVLKMPNAQNLREGLPSSVAELGTNWYEHAKNAGIGGAFSVVISPVPFENKGPVVEFSTRPGIYKFDAEVLEIYAQKYKVKVLELLRQKRDEKKGLVHEEQTQEKGEFEQYLDNCLATRGERFVSACLQLTFSTVKKEEISNKFKDFTKDGQDKYRKLLGR